MYDHHSLSLFTIQYDKHIITQIFQSKYNRIIDIMEEKILEEDKLHGPTTLYCQNVE